MSNLDENYDVTNEEELDREGESKAEKFQRLAVPRINKLLSGIESLGKLGNRSSYDYTEEQVTKMFEALRGALDSAEGKFKPKEEKKGNGFSF